MKKNIFLLACAFLLFCNVKTQAVTPDEILANPLLEARARDISSQLRCLVCQNETIDASNASLAHDLRLLVRERLTKGDSNEQVISYIVARYGEYVLLKPRFKGMTIMLWLSPFFILIAVFMYIFYVLKTKKHALPKQLTQEEKQRLQKILNQ